MHEDIQKASVHKRAAAYLLDLILLSVIIVGVACLLSLIMGYDAERERLTAYYDQYAKEFGVDFNISTEEYEALSHEEKKAYEDATKAMNANEDAVICYNKIVNTSFMIVTASILAGYLLLEFAVPLLFRNGQTVGKKIFSLAVIREDCVRVSALQMFVRAILGKGTVGTLVPAMVVLMIFFGTPNLLSLLIVAALLVTQILMICVTSRNLAIHDRMASTVVVDLPSQMVFDSPEHLLEYKKQRHREMAEAQPYF